MELPREWAQMDAQQLRDLTASLLEQLQQRDNQLTEQKAELSRRDEELKRRELKIEQLTHEMAILKRWQYARRSEQLDAVQYSLLDESIDADLAAIELEIEALRERPAKEPKSQPRRVALPAHLPRREIRHEPDDTHCSCGCALERFGEDISEKLDYTPGVFEVERHIRGKWVCRRCERLIQAPVPPQVIDKGIPTAALLAQVLIAKYLDHLPLYRQESIFERAGLAIARSTLAQWVGACGQKLHPLVAALKVALLSRSVLHADETPVPMLKPGLKRTHKAYLWSYSSSEYDELPAVVYDFAEGRGGQYARQFLGSWSGKLVCDDYTNEPMSYVRDECPDRGICLHSWWKAVIQVEKTLQGTPLSGHITAAVMQHTSMNAKYKKAVRYFVLEAIEDPSTRKRLRADYYLKEGSIDPPDDK
jgi:transposase